MRTQTTAQALAYSSASQRQKIKLEIKDSSGTWQEWTDLYEQDRVVSIDWGEDVDSPGQDASISLFWRYYYDNASPYVSGSRISGYLALGRELKIHVAVVPQDVSVGAGDWIEVFHGKIDTLDLANEPGTITARDVIMAQLADRWVEDETVYGDNGGTLDIEDVIQDLLDDWTDGSITLEVPTGTSFAIVEYKQQRMPVLQAIQDLVALIGWDIRPKWSEADSEWQLTLYEPDRSTATSLASFSPEIWHAVDRASIDFSRIRNVVEVTYVSGTDDSGDVETSTVTATDTASVTKYGRRWMEVVEGTTSQIDTSGEATALATAIVTDLAEPELDFGVSVPLWPWAEINDYYAFEADGRRFGADQKLAVQGYRHTFTAEQFRTAFVASGQPKAGVVNWLEREARPGQADNKKDLAPAALSLPAVTEAALAVVLRLGWPRDGDWDLIEVHRSTTSSFTPSASTLIGTARGTRFIDRDADPDTDYYYRTIVKSKSGLRSAASPETSAKSPNFVEREQLGVKLRQGARLEMSADQTSSTSPFVVGFDTLAVGTSDYANTSTVSIKPIGGGFCQVSIRVAPGSGQDATTWRVDLMESGTAAVVATSGDQDDLADLLINEPIALDKNRTYRCEITFTGTSIDIDSTRSHFAFVGTPVT
jgi:hypothetical protein